MSLNPIFPKSFSLGFGVWGAWDLGFSGAKYLKVRGSADGAYHQDGTVPERTSPPPNIQTFPLCYIPVYGKCEILGGVEGVLILRGAS